MKFTGVDIGTTAVRAVELAGVDSSGFALVTRVGMAPVPFGAISAGRIRDPKEVSVALVRAVRDAGISRRGFVLGLGTPDVAIQRMALPAAIHKFEREDAIRAMGQSLAPTFELADSVLATQLLTTGEKVDDLEMSTMSVAAAHREDVEVIKAVCKLARCSPRALDLSGAALLRSLSRANEDYGEVSTVVDVGASKVIVATRAGHYLRSVRTTAGAGVELTRTLAQAMGVDQDAAEEMKLSVKLPPPAQRLASGYAAAQQDESPLHERVLAQSADMVIDSIAQSVESDATNFGSYTQGVTLCGGTALLRGFKDRLQRRLGVPVIIGRPWADIERSRRNAQYFVDGQLDPRVLLSLSTAVGLALWKEPL